MERLETAFKIIFTTALVGFVLGTLVLVPGVLLGMTDIQYLAGWLILPALGLAVIALAIIVVLFVWFG